MNDKIQQASEKRNPIPDAGDPSAKVVDAKRRADKARPGPDHNVSKIRRPERTARNPKSEADGSATTSKEVPEPGPGHQTKTADAVAKPDASAATPDRLPDSPLLPTQARYLPALPENDEEFADDDVQSAGAQERASYPEDASRRPEADPVDVSNGEAIQQEPTVAGIMQALRSLPAAGIWVPKLIRRITKNGDQAILLSQVLYWFDNDRRGRQRAQTFKNGRYWVYKTHEDLAEETGLTATRVKKCLSALRKQGYVETDYFLAQGLRTTHISVNVEIVRQELRNAYSTRENAGQHDSVSRSDRNGPSGQTDSC